MPDVEAGKPLFIRRRDPATHASITQHMRKSIELPQPNVQRHGSQSSFSRWLKPFKWQTSKARKETVDLELSSPSLMELGEKTMLSLQLLLQSDDKHIDHWPLRPEIRLISIEHKITSTIWTRVPGGAIEGDGSVAKFFFRDHTDHHRRWWRFTTGSVSSENRILQEGEKLDLDKELDV
jgi:hypothetical protein